MRVCFVCQHGLPDQTSPGRSGAKGGHGVDLVATDEEGSHCVPLSLGEAASCHRSLAGGCSTASHLP